MRQKLLQLTIITLMLTCCHQLQNRKHDYYSYDYPYNSYNRYQNKYTYDQASMDTAASIIAVIIIVGFIVAVGAACYYCCKALRNRSNNTRQIVGNPPYLQPPIVTQYSYQQQPPHYPLQQLPNGPVQAGIPANFSATTHQTVQRERLNSPCSQCNIRYKQGEEPRAMLGCQQKHTFHLSCLSQAIKQQNQFVCPHCNQRIPSNIRLFCVSCKTNNANVNVQDYRHPSQGLNIEIIKARYGQCCPSCSGI